jgi:hypothetical protein
MRLALTLLALLATTTAQAGGPVITEEEAPAVAPATEDGRVPGWAVPVAIGAIVLIAILSGSSACNGEPVTPPPSGGC